MEDGGIAQRHVMSRDVSLSICISICVSVCAGSPGRTPFLHMTTQK